MSGSGCRSQAVDQDVQLAACPSLIGIFTVARPPEHDARASRLLNILMDGLRPAP